MNLAGALDARLVASPVQLARTDVVAVDEVNEEGPFERVVAVGMSRTRSSRNSRKGTRSKNVPEQENALGLQNREPAAQKRSVSCSQMPRESAASLRPKQPPWRARGARDCSHRRILARKCLPLQWRGPSPKRGPRKGQLDKRELAVILQSSPNPS